MSDRDFNVLPLKAFVARAVWEREELDVALRKDRDSEDYQSQIRDFESGRREGAFPAGETAKLIDELRPADGQCRLRQLFFAAQNAVIAGGVAEYFLPKLEALLRAHERLLESAVRASEIGSVRIDEDGEHCLILSHLAECVEGIEGPAPGTRQEPNTVPAAGGSPDAISVTTLSRILEDEQKRIVEIIGNTSLATEDKLRDISEIDRRYWVKTSVELGRILGLTEQAIRATRWWRVDRKKYLAKHRAAD